MCIKKKGDLGMGILVFDVGTSSMRGALLNDKAEILCQFQRKYHPTFYSSVKVTQDPEIWRKALYDIARDVGDWCKDHNEEVEMISLTAQRTSIIPVDHKGDRLCDAVMWQDKRNIEVCTRLSAMNGQIIRKSGTMVNPVFSGSKMAWLKETQPEIYKKADRIFVVADYLLYHMTGQRKLDRTYASRSHLMNLRTGRWDSVLLDIFGIEKNKLCNLIDPGELHGYTNEKFAASTRLKTGIPVYSAGGDQQCSALGMGIYEEGDMEVTSGTGAFIIGITEKVPIVLLGNPIINYSAVKGKYIVEASILTCSAAFDWFCNNFYKEVNGDVYQKIDQEISQSPPGANGCMLLPFFQGRATPQWNPKATASFTNVTLSTTRGDMVRALLEGIAYEIRNNLDIVEGQIGKADQIHIGGGLSNSHEFNQIQADVYGRKLIHYQHREAGIIGAWTSTMVESGKVSDHEEALERAGRNNSLQIYEPVEKNIEKYQELRADMNHLYQKIY